MRINIRNLIVGIVFVGVFGLLFAKPFLSSWWKANAGDLICMVGVIGLSLILLYNKLTCGVFFPGPPKDAAGQPKP